MSAEPSPEEQFDLLTAELADRMEEYLVALRAIPASDSSKADLWRAACNKREEIDKLNTELAHLLPILEAAEPSDAVRILSDACKAVGWKVGDHRSARALIQECLGGAEQIRSRVARDSALKWLRHALRYAEAGRRNQATSAIRNAHMQLGY